jgi:ABC-2 type transport system ATP-binding protein
MICAQEIDFTYPKSSCPALNNVRLEVTPYRIHTLLGPNGAGKTTLLRIISGLIEPQSGTVMVCGFDMRSQEHHARSCIGLVLGEERSFYYRLSGAQNLEFFGGLRDLQRRELRKRITSLLGLVGLAKDAKLQYMRYSTGMKKRLALARALLHDPQVLLLDEPNSGIDPASALTIREILTEQRRQGKTILLTTHDMTEAERLSDQIGFLKSGRLLKVGTLEEFQSLCNKKRLEVDFRPCATSSDVRLSRLEHRIRTVSCFAVIRAQDNRLSITYNGSFDMAAVLAEISASGLEVVRTNTYSASLEEVFIQLAG